MKAAFSQIILLVAGCLCFTMNANSQVGVNDDNSPPDPSAQLDVKSSTRGFLPPRVSLTSISSPGPLSSPATGLLVYNTATAGTPPNNVIPGYYYWNGTRWIAVVSPQGISVGDMLYWNGTQWVVVPAGSSGQVLTFSNGVPAWGGVQLPIVSTTAITNITSVSASSGGTVSSDGYAPVTARGVCWSTSPNPTTASNFTSDGSGMGSFASTITGLTTSTTYYLRAYATNSAGTAYGNQVTFVTAFSPFNARVLVVGGGGGGAPGYGTLGQEGAGGGGGAGGYAYNATYAVSSSSPITVTVGSGGSGYWFSPTNGTGSAFGTVTTCGGLLGGKDGGNACNGMNGGIGVLLGAGGGGGGYIGTGGNATSTNGGNGGAGISNDISGSSVVYCGGGGGGPDGGTPGTSVGTYGGGGQGGNSGMYGSGLTGQNGIVIIRYTSPAQLGSGGTVTTVGGEYIHTFTASGTFTPY